MYDVPTLWNNHDFKIIVLLFESFGEKNPFDSAYIYLPIVPASFIYVSYAFIHFYISCCKIY